MKRLRAALALVAALLLSACAGSAPVAPTPVPTPTAVPTLFGADVFKQAGAGAGALAGGTPLALQPTSTPTPTVTPTPQPALTQAPRPRFAAESITPSATPTRAPEPGTAPVPPRPGAPPPQPRRAGPLTVIILPGAAEPTPVPLAPTLEPMTPPPAARKAWRNAGGKIGLGIYPGAGKTGLQAAYLVKPAVVVLMDEEVGLAPAIKGTFPNCFIVGRRFARVQPLDRPAEQGVSFADMVAGMAVGPVRAAVDAWQSYNEPVAHNGYADYAAWNSFQAAFARRLQDTYGLAAVAGNDATAAIEPYDYPRYFKEAVEVSAYFGVHSYAPTLETAMGADNLMRYRQIRQAFADARVNVGPFILTETGMTNGYHNASPAVTDAQISRMIQQLSDPLRQDDYVIGQAVYGIFGTNNQAWNPFDLTGSSALSDWGAYNERYR